MNNNPKVCWLTCTKGRHTFIERNIRMFLDQDYENKIMVIYNNSDVKQELDKELDKEYDNVILVNRCIDSKTGKPYDNLGAIYNDALAYIPEDVDLLNGADDDDIFLPNHISEGVKGYLKGKELNPDCKAYKPAKSYYVYLNQPIEKVSNILEPSIFVEMSHIREHKYHNNTENQHHKWLDALGSNIFVDEEGISTMIYDWSQQISAWKASGDPNNPSNFHNCEKNSQDHGDKIITPVDSCEQWYNLIKNNK